MSKELSQKSRRNIYVGAWILIVIQVMALVNWIINSPERGPASEVSLLQQPTSRVAGELIGINALPLVALIAGLTLLRHKKNKESKTIVIAAATLIGLSILFAPL